MLFSCFYRAPVPIDSVSSMSAAQHTILLASTCPSFLVGWGDPSFSLYTLLSSELSQGVLHSPCPWRGWGGGPIAGGACGSQHKRNYSMFVGWWEWFVSRIGRFSVHFLHVVSQLCSVDPWKHTVLGEEIHYGPCVSLHVVSGYAKNSKPQSLYPGGFSEFSLDGSILGCGNTSPKEQDCLCSLSKQPISQAQSSSPASQTSASVSIQVNVPSLPAGLWGNGYNQYKHGVLPTASDASSTSLSLTQGPPSSVCIRQSVAN